MCITNGSSPKAKTSKRSSSARRPASASTARRSHLSPRGMVAPTVVITLTQRTVIRSGSGARKRVDPLPDNVRRGGNDDAFKGQRGGAVDGSHQCGCYDQRLHAGARRLAAHGGLAANVRARNHARIACRDPPELDYRILTPPP